jgi:hypothetical protein
MSTDNPQKPAAIARGHGPPGRWESLGAALGLFAGAIYGLILGIVDGEEAIHIAAACIYPALMGAIFFAIAGSVIRKVIGGEDV